MVAHDHELNKQPPAVIALPAFQVLTAQPILAGGLTAADFRDGFVDVRWLKGSNRTHQPILETSNVLSERTAIEKYSS